MNQNLMVQELSDNELEQVVGGHHYKPQPHKCHEGHGHHRHHCHEPKPCFFPPCPPHHCEPPAPHCEPPVSHCH
jgi:bacteriocin-like protein